MTSNGFDHGKRGIGVRNHQLILPSVVCSTHISRRIASAVGALSFSHQHGCGIIGADGAGIEDFFGALANHPNVSSCLIVSLGCETIQGQELGARLASANVATKYQIIQDSGGVEATVSAGILAARHLQESYPPVKAAFGNITVGIDLCRESAQIAELIAGLSEVGVETIVAWQGKSSAENFSQLMLAKAHVILSFPSPDQPASGFPLIPVINVASESSLHQGIVADFDLAHESTIEATISRIMEVADAQATIAEMNGTGEILAPRLVRST